MARLRVGLLVAVGVFVLVVGAALTVFYLRVYQPLGSPLMAMAAPHLLEERQLRNRDSFAPPVSGVLTGDHVARFIAVEEAVALKVGAGAEVLAAQRRVLEQADAAGTLSVGTALSAFGAIRPVLLEAKVAQIEAMNQANVSKAEFEWVRRQVYAAAGVTLSQVDVSEIVAGDPNPVVTVRRITGDGPGRDDNARLARPLAARLETWSVLAFFGL